MAFPGGGGVVCLGVSSWGVSGQGGVCPGGVCIPACTGQGGVYPSMHWAGGCSSPREQNSWHTLVKTLPFCNYIANGNKSQFIVGDVCSDKDSCMKGIYCQQTATIYIPNVRYVYRWQTVSFFVTLPWSRFVFYSDTSRLSGGSRIFQMGGRCFVANGGAHILFSGKKCMKLKEIGLKWGGARLLAPCYSKITIFLWIILNSIMKTSYFTYLRIFWDILYKIIF